MTEPDPEWTRRVDAFRAELETLLEVYNVHLITDSYGGGVSLTDALRNDLVNCDLNFQAKGLM